MTMSAGIGSGGDLDAGGERSAQALHMVFLKRQRALAHMRLRRFAVIVVDREGRHKENAAFGHRVEQLGLLVEIAAVLDRIDPGCDRDPKASAAERMAHDAAVERMRLVDERLHLVEIEGAVARTVL